MYQISPMNWIFILFIICFLFSYLFSMMNSFEKKSLFLNVKMKIYVK